jgi:hypothetical protein
MDDCHDFILFYPSVWSQMRTSFCLTAILFSFVG